MLTCLVGQIVKQAVAAKNNQIAVLDVHLRGLTPLSKAGSCEVVDAQHVGRLFHFGAFKTETMSNNVLQKKESSETGMNIVSEERMWRSKKNE